MSKKATRRTFTKEFKEEAARLCEEEGRSVAEVARNLGINENMLFRWRQEYVKDPANSFLGAGRLKPGDEKYRKLEKELANVRMERDILKKALAIFSRHQK